MRGRLLDLEAARSRSLADLKLGASMSLTERELDALEQLLGKLRIGGDSRILARAPEVAAIARKVAVAKRSAETARARREAVQSAKGDR